MKSTVIPKQKPISKEKVKEVLDIMDVAHAFSGAINERPRQPLILCPFHNDMVLCQDLAQVKMRNLSSS